MEKEKEKQILKKTNITIYRNLKKLERELISLEREFNWLRRQNYQENYDSLSLEKVKRSRKKINSTDKFEKKQIVNEISGDVKVKKVNCKDPAKKPRKKKVIVWNAWVLDTSSESESD